MTEIPNNLTEIITEELKARYSETTNETTIASIQNILDVLNSLDLLNGDHYQSGVAIGEANIETLKAKLLVATTITEQLPDGPVKKSLLKTLKP